MKRLSDMKNYTFTRPLNLNLILCLCLSLCLSLNLNLISAQKDPEALKILTAFSNKATSAPSISIDFTFITNDSRDGSVNTMEGSVVMTGDKYKLSMPDNSVWADGKNVWSYLPDVNEVTITASDPDDESFMSRPSMLFTLYEEGYKVRLLEQTEKEWVIDLYPEDLTLNLVRIRLRIAKTTYSLKKAEYVTKDGITVTLIAGRFDLTFKPAANYFTFNASDYKGVDVIDMR
ncbi:MAG: outer membrane lipoprotein carrier protein LolA [Bacteroidales bacterium]|jgi:outer membrane lipoprotein-sorting protein|nr:outer membrane lipoprotein carrier protein LolA [Bacteroidales bacterium]